MSSPTQHPGESGKPTRGRRLAADALGRFQAGLQRYLLRRLRGTQDVEDLAQEVYLRLLRVKDGEPVKYPQAYVYRVAFNVLYEFKFHKKNEPVAFDSNAAADAAGELQDEAEPLEETYERERREQRLNAAIAQLSPMQRAVFLLAKHQDMSHAQIAGRLGISINTARVHLHRAVCHCKDALS